MTPGPSIRRQLSAFSSRQVTQKVLVAEPDHDVRELVFEHCRRLGVEPISSPLDARGALPDIDLIIAEPASVEGQAAIAAHRTETSRVPIVFLSIYPPARGVLKSPAVAYLVMPCSWDQFERVVSNALQRASLRR